MFHLARLAMHPAARSTAGFLFIAMAAGLAAAQGRSPPAPAGGATVPVDLEYRSTCDGYQRFADEKVGPWIDANDTVGRIGGWRAYAREAGEADARGPAPAGAPAPVTRGSPPAADPHSGHGKH